MCVCLFFFQAEDGIRDLVRSRGLGDVYKRQVYHGRPRFVHAGVEATAATRDVVIVDDEINLITAAFHSNCCLLYTSDAADERSSVDLGGRRIIKKKKKQEN